MHLNTSSDTIGQVLRRARQQQNLSYAEVSEKTRIQQSYIMAIESQQVSELPSLGYVLGYVRTYASFLGLNASDCVAQFKTQISAPKHLGMRDRALFVAKRRIRLPRGFISAVLVMSCALCVALWYGSKVPNTGINTVANAETFSVDDIESLNTAITAPDVVTLKAVGPTWMQAKDAEGRVMFSRILVTGESWSTVRGAGVSLSVRDAGALDIYLGETRIGSLGKKGVPMDNIKLVGALSPNVSVAEISTLEAPR